MLRLSRLAVAIAPGSLVLGLATLQLLCEPAHAAGVGLTGPFALDNWKLIPTVEGVEKPAAGNPIYVCSPVDVQTGCIDGPNLGVLPPATPTTIQVGPPGGFSVVGAATGDYDGQEGNSVDIAWTLEYKGEVDYRLSFDILFDSADSAQDIKSYFSVTRLGFTQKVYQSTGDYAQAGFNYVIQKGDSIAFGVLTPNLSNNIGILQITNFDAEPVPAPLPLLGAGAAFGWSRRLRRRIRSRVAMASR